MIEVRIADHQWHNLHTDAQIKIKELARDLGSDYGYDFEYNYYWIKFTKENFLLAKIKEFDAAQLMKVV